ncbi:MAG: type III pantothenate kinase [Candidatus Kapabacteria bacterium]|nr:type III pantothenate kinase [Candidatus Kapabacteria bacterium]
MTTNQSDMNLTKATGLIAIDIGNSRIKILTESDYFSSEYKENWFDSLRYFLSKITGKQILGISQVNSIIYNKFLDIIDDNADLQPVSVDILLQNQKILKYNHIKGIGSDRLMGMIGALSITNPPLITIDCGTATTVNFINLDSVCLGGLIFAGMKTQIMALTEHTDRLKDTELFFNESVLGENSDDCIRLGVIYSTVGAIKEAINRTIAAELIPNNKLTLVFTGGLSKIILKYFENTADNIIYDENLVLKGINYLLKSDNFVNISK